MLTDPSRALAPYRRLVMAGVALIGVASVLGCNGLTVPKIGKQDHEAAPATPAKSSDAAANKPSTQSTGSPAQAADKAVADVIYPDGRSCQAVSDGGVMSNLYLLGQIGMALGADMLQQAPQLSDAALQARLDKAKPGLRELSKRLIWLPQASEILIGKQMLSMSGYKPYKPSSREQRFIQQTLQPIFDRLARYANDELKTDLDFKMEFFSVNSVSAEMVPGGTMVIPHRLLTLLMSMPDKASADRYNLAAFVMAHEFSHALRRHLTKSTQMRLVDGMTMASVFKQNFKGVSTGLDAATSITQMFDLSQKGIELAMNAVCTGEKWFTSFDVNQEAEADVCGALLLSKLEESSPSQKVSAVDGLRQYNKLVASLGKPTPRPGICVQQATHPDVPQREANLGTYEKFLDGKR